MSLPYDLNKELTKKEPNRVFIDLRNPTKATYEAISKRTKRKIFTLDDIKNNLPKTFSKKLGKVGYMYTNEEGHTVKVVQDERYLTDDEYRLKVNEVGFTPAFAEQKALNKTIKVVNLEVAVNALRKKMHIQNFTKSNKSAFFKTIKVVATTAPINYMMIKKSVNKMAREKMKDATIKETITQGLRIGILSAMSLTHQDKMCRMTDTSSMNPDMEHMFLEGLPMHCPELFVILSRFGCNHDYEVIGEQVKVVFN